MREAAKFSASRPFCASASSLAIKNGGWAKRNTLARKNGVVSNIGQARLGEAW